MSANSRRYLVEQLRILLHELENSKEITADFVRARLASITEHARGFVASLPAVHSSQPYEKGGHGGPKGHIGPRDVSLC